VVLGLASAGLAATRAAPLEIVEIAPGSTSTTAFKKRPPLRTTTRSPISG